MTGEYNLSYPLLMSDIMKIGDSGKITEFFTTLLNNMTEFDEVENPVLNIVTCMRGATVLQFNASFYLTEKAGKPFGIAGFNPEKMNYRLMLLSTLTEENHLMLVQKLFYRMEGLIRCRNPDIKVQVYKDTRAFEIFDYLFLKLSTDRPDWGLEKKLLRN